MHGPTAWTNRIPEIGSPPQPSLRAGAGRARIDLPPGLFPVDGFAAERDPLYARVVILEAADSRIVLAVLDQTSISPESLAGITRTLTGVTGAEPDQMLVCASHTFSAPHVVLTGANAVGETLQRCLQDAVDAAAAAAVRTLRPARLGCATGAARVSVNRDVWTPEGWWLGADDAADTDPEVGVLRIEDADARPIAVLMNYAVQPSVLHESATADGRRLVSADLAGAAAAHVENAYGDAVVALFLVGAAADQAPYFSANRYVGAARIDLHEAGHVLADLQGERLGAEVLRVSEQITSTADAPALRLVHGTVEVGAQPLPRRDDLRPRTTYDYRASGSAAAGFWVARIGDLALAGVQAELSCVTGRWIKQNSPFPVTFVMTMVNGAAKYMADVRSYQRITYAAMNSRYAAGAAEKVASRIAKALRQLH